MCHVCDRAPIQDKMDLLSHAEDVHGTVIRGRIQEKLILEYRKVLLISAAYLRIGISSIKITISDALKGSEEI